MVMGEWQVPRCLIWGSDFRRQLALTEQTRDSKGNQKQFRDKGVGGRGSESAVVVTSLLVQHRGSHPKTIPEIL